MDIGSYWSLHLGTHAATRTRVSHAWIMIMKVVCCVISLETKSVCTISVHLISQRSAIANSPILLLNVVKFLAVICILACNEYCPDVCMCWVSQSCTMWYVGMNCVAWLRTYMTYAHC